MSDSTNTLQASGRGAQAATGDRALVVRMLAGEEEAFGRFFEDHFPRLYRFALPRLGRDADAAEEVVQIALCNAISGLKSYRGEASLFTWLCTICRREILAYRKRHARRLEPVDLIDDSPGARAALESLGAVLSLDPEVALERREVARLVQVTLDALPRAYGDALEWKYMQGLSVKEIAARLDLGAKAAESLLTRARVAFRDGFAELTSLPVRSGGA